MKKLTIIIVGTGMDNLIYQTKRITADLQANKTQKEYVEDGICDYNFIVVEEGVDDAQAWTRASVNNRIKWLKKEGLEETYARYKFDALPIFVINAIRVNPRI